MNVRTQENIYKIENSKRITMCNKSSTDQITRQTDSLILKVVIKLSNMQSLKQIELESNWLRLLKVFEVDKDLEVLFVRKINTSLKSTAELLNALSKYFIWYLNNIIKASTRKYLNN